MFICPRLLFIYNAYMKLTFLQIYYVIRNALDDNLSGFEVVVDNWPKWNCILLRPESSDKVCRQYHESKSNENVIKYSPSPKREVNIVLQW